jgi:hypothetical protein
MSKNRPQVFTALMLALTLTAHLTAPAFAAARQDATAQQPAATSEVTLPDGTEFMVETTEEISSKSATEGDALTFRVLDDVRANGKVVIAKGTLVKGMVANAKKAGMMGKGGTLGIRVESTTTVDNQKLKLRSSKGKEGDDKTGTTVALVVLFGPLGFLKHGKNAKIKSGTQIKVFTDEEKKVKAAA